MSADEMIKKSVNAIIGNLQTPFRIVGGILIVCAIGLTAIMVIGTKKNEKRTQVIMGLPAILCGSYLLGAMSLFLGFFNNIMK